ncbi:cytochrome P450 CYP749A22-like [Cornus florida]|uniref:cytochrome P450 CYP749A22-like n=1 Tax=Cornus florida TaxID=4283 RepID=UPI00289B4824|nr:cytochrome P450 CYP749A22-like [Cornus florida]
MADLGTLVIFLSSSLCLFLIFTLIKFFHKFVTNSEFVKKILNDRDGAYKKMDIEGYLKKLLGAGVLVAEGEKWTIVRKLANHAFHADQLKNMILEMISSTEMMLERWKQYEGKEVDVYEEFKLYIINGRNAFKIRLPGFSKFLRIADDLESDKLEQGIRDSIIRIIKQREKTTTGEVNNFGTDLLGLLVKANHHADENYRITVEDVVEKCNENAVEKF